MPLDRLVINTLLATLSALHLFLGASAFVATGWSAQLFGAHIPVGFSATAASTWFTQLSGVYAGIFGICMALCFGQRERCTAFLLMGLSYYLLKLINRFTLAAQLDVARTPVDITLAVDCVLLILFMTLLLLTSRTSAWVPERPPEIGLQKQNSAWISLIHALTNKRKDPPLGHYVLLGCLLFAMGYHFSQGITVFLPPEYVDSIANAYGWSLSTLSAEEFDLGKGYAAYMLVFAVAAALPLIDPPRFGFVVSLWGLFFLAKGILMIHHYETLQTQFHASDARLITQISVMFFLAAAFLYFAGRNRPARSSPSRHKTPSSVVV